MMNKRSFDIRTAALIGAATCLLAAASVPAETFVSYNGGFRISYPPGWMQVDYRTADYYIEQASGKLDYEGVFMPRTAPSFFEGDYLILTVDTVGQLSQQQIDSVLDALAKDLGRKVNRVAPEEFMTAAEGNDLEYDQESQAIAVFSDVVIGQTTPKKNVLAMKFYERGIANFYFYTARTDFERSLPLFKQLFSTFSIESRQTAAVPKPVNVFDPEARRNDAIILALAGLIVLVVVIVAVVFITRRRRRKQQDIQSQT